MKMPKKMKRDLNPIRLIAVVLTIVLSASSAIAATNVTIKTSLDSAYIIMGRTTPLHIQIVQDQGIAGRFVNVGDTLNRYVEVNTVCPPDTQDIGSGRQEILQDLIIQSFDSGLYTLPPLVYAADGDTFRSNELVLKVLPVPVDTMQTVHDFAGVTVPHTKLWDYLPDFVADYWWVYLILVLLALGAAAWIIWRKRHQAAQEAEANVPQLPPYELAVMQLNELKSEKLCENSREKEYYTRLTDILRVYLETRFGINAMEMTSTQIMRSVRSHDTTKPSASLMKQILEIADFVKFAKVRPLPDDNTKSFNQALQFVEDTKPEPQPEAEADTTSDADKNDNKKTAKP
jgi:hypothetical protein